MAVDYGSLPFAEALEFFRRKLNLPTKKWDDLLGAAHDRAFVVAGAMQADLLMDLRAAVEKALADGTTYETFRKDFKKIVAARGWTGWTGEGTKAGEAWRTRVIYDTNLFTSYSAGRYRQMKEVAKSRPWWRYRHSPASRVPRAEHLAWDGKVLRHDDPWWSAHTPPNGFGCKCYIETLADRDLKRMGIEPLTGPQMPYPDSGVDKGWDYQPGARENDLWSNLIRDKLIRWDPRLSAQTWEKTRDVLLPDLMAEFAAWLQTVDPNIGGKANGERRVVGVLTPTLLEALAQRGILPKAADLSIEDHELQHLLRQHKQNNPKNIALPRAEVERLPEHLAHPDAVLWDEEAAKKGEPALLYVFTIPGEEKRGKYVVRVDFPTWVKEDGMKMKRWLNTVRTGGMLETVDLKVPRYRPIEGAL
jgi:hypothetical protein